MQGVARTGDSVSGVCSASGHPSNRGWSGVWSSVHSTLHSDGVGMILVGDTGSTSCGHTFRASTGSSVAGANGTALHRSGDAVVIVEGPGSGSTNSGSSVVLSA